MQKYAQTKAVFYAIRQIATNFPQIEAKMHHAAPFSSE
jgi:hypothetical protein